MIEKKLPKGWIDTSIKEINLRKSENVNPAHFPSEIFESYSVPIFSEGEPEIVEGNTIKASKQVVYGNEVLLCKINPRINRVWQVGNYSKHKKIASSEWIIIDTKNIILSGFLKYQFSTPFFRVLMQSEVSGVGGSLTRARPKIVENYRFSLPPLPEQKRIVAKLDKLFANLAVLKKKLEGIPKLMEDFRQSVLTQAVSGKLTEEWRKGKRLENWNDVTLLDVILSKPRNGFSPKGVEYETPVKSLSLSATTSGKFDKSKVKYLDIKVPEKDSHLWLKKGDILIQRSNSLEYVGTAAIYDCDDFEFMYPDIMMKVTVNDKVSNKFLYYCLSENRVRDYYMKNATGTAGNMPKINQGVVSNTPIILPPIKEQKEIVRRVESLFVKATVIEERYQKLKSQIDDLPQAILAKAFRGELVEQLASDGDARELLKEIGEMRANIVKKKKK